ncbi:MAG: SDR family oxidoreductase [Actinomycetota bacterium]
MRYVITGGSGYIGSRLVDRLSEREDTERIVICDVRPPASFRPKAEYQELDVRDAARAREILERERPDALVHLAFILNPMRDERTMYDIDVNGTHNVLEAASATGVEHVLVTSSTTAYGAFPDNPVPLTEDDPVRGVADFEYARDKTESDRLCQLWALRHPDRTMTILRPCIVFGPNVDNYISRSWTDAPFLPDVGGMDTPVQFVHEDDVVEALVGLLAGRHGGAFNVTGDGTVTWRETAEIAGVKVRRLPLPVARRIGAFMWRVGQSEAPPGNLHFLLHPWVASNEKLKQTLGWNPRYTSREAFVETMRAKRGQAAGEAAGERRTAAMLASPTGR